MGVELCRYSALGCDNGKSETVARNQWDAAADVHEAKPSTIAAASRIAPLMNKSAIALYGFRYAIQLPRIQTGPAIVAPNSNPRARSPRQ